MIIARAEKESSSKVKKFYLFLQYTLTPVFPSIIIFICVHVGLNLVTGKSPYHKSRPIKKLFQLADRLMQKNLSLPIFHFKGTKTSYLTRQGLGLTTILLLVFRGIRYLISYRRDFYGILIIVQSISCFIFLKTVKYHVIKWVVTEPDSQ